MTRELLGCGRGCLDIGDENSIRPARNGSFGEFSEILYTAGMHVIQVVAVVVPIK